MRPGMLHNSQSSPPRFSAVGAASGGAGRCVILAFVLLLIWVPAVSHYYVRTPSIGLPLIEAARASPADEKLEELTRLFVPPMVADETRVAVAEHALNGQIDTLLQPITIH